MSRVAAAAALVALAAGAAAAAPPPCRVETRVEPARAVVGEQVLYRARVLHRDEVVAVEWAHPPAFASFRTEILPGDPRSDRPLRDGVRYRVRDEVRALFADRPGRFTLGAPELLCRLAGAARVAVAVPDVSLRIDPLPAAGRPAGFEGLVGPLSLVATVTPRAVRLGQTVRVALMAQGTGNLWALAPPWSERDFPAADVFARPPERVLDRGRALFVRRHFVYDVVPREAGALRVPGLAVPYFDPDEDRYRVARTEPVEVRVAAAPARGAPPADPSPAPAPAADVPEAPAPGAGPLLVGLAALVALAALAAGAWRVGRGRGLRARHRARALAREAEALEDPEARAAALARALRAALDPALPGADTADPEALRARAGDAPALREAVRLLGALERARFDPAARAPEPGEVRSAIDAALAGAPRRDR